MIFAILPTVLATALAATVVAPLPEQPQAGEDEPSKILFHKGRKLMQEGRYAEALTMLVESERLKATPVTLLNIALCHVELGKLGNALFELREAREEDSGANPEVTSFMADRLREVEAKVAAAPVPHIEIALEPDAAVPGVRVALDEIWLSSVLLAKPIPVDEGEHRVMARDNQGLADQKVYVHGRDTTKVNLSLGASPTPSLGPLFTSALVVGGIGLVGTIVTSVVADRR